MKKISILLLLSLYIFPGCTKESNAPLQVTKLNNARFATSANPNLKPTFTQLACIVDSMAGTECVDAKGSSCSALTMCTPIKNQIQSGLYTKDEIDQKINLVEKAYGVRYTY
jgi:hypothetical protein